jgi:hypothetical protein
MNGSEKLDGKSRSGCEKRRGGDEMLWEMFDKNLQFRPDICSKENE